MKMFTDTLEHKKGVVKRSSGFVVGTERAKSFKCMQDSYGFTKYDAKNILSDNQKKLGLNQSEACILNALIKFSSMSSWKEALPICTATNARIGEASGYKKGTVSNVLRILEDKGFILRNSYNKYNQRVGDEPISLAPFGAMLPDWIDEELVQWKLNHRENITGRKQTHQEIMITRDDKKAFYHEKDLNVVYKDDVKSIQKEEYGLNKSSCKGSSNHVPRSMKSLTIKDKVINNHVKKTNKKIVKDFKKVKTAELFPLPPIITDQAIWEESIWKLYDRIILSCNVKNSDVVQALKSRSAFNMHNACVELLKSKMPKFNLRLLGKAFTGKLKDSVWRGGLMILYSLYHKSIKNKNRYLGYLCNSQEMILIEHNIKKLTYPIKRVTPDDIVNLLNEKFDFSNFDNKGNFVNYVISLYKILGSAYIVWVNDIVKCKGNTIYFSKKLAVQHLKMKCSPERFNLHFKHITEEI